MSDQEENKSAPASRKGFSGAQVTGIVLLTMLVTVFAGWWIVRTYLFPSQLEPVELSQREQVELGTKLRRLGVVTSSPNSSASDNQVARPEPYTEKNADRNVFLSERELNSLLANDPKLASRLAVDLADDLASVVVLIPIPQDFPVMPGRTVRVNAGAEVSFAAGRPVVALKGVSIMGVPVPNAWLGNLKNVDLVREFGGNDGFWKSFADGIDEIRVEDGQLLIRLRE
jgi:hypothetical protein